MPQQIYDVLKQEHREISQMLQQLTEGQPDQQRIDELYTKLEAHTQAEEKTLYVDLKQPEQTHGLILEAIEEHHVADVLLKEIRQMDPADEQCSAKLEVLKENVEHHVEEEEQNIFPKAQQLMDDAWAEQCAQSFQQQEQQLKQQLH